MSIDFSWRLKGISHDTGLTGVSQSAGTAAGTNAVSAKTSATSADGITSIKEDFKDWLEQETAKITADGGSASEVVKAVTESVGASNGTDGVTELAEMKQLIDSLDKSILGGVASSLDSTEVAADLLSAGRGSDRVIGQLLSGQLVEAAVEDIKARGGKVKATCWYAAEWLEKHSG